MTLSDALTKAIRIDRRTTVSSKQCGMQKQTKDSLFYWVLGRGYGKNSLAKVETLVRMLQADDWEVDKK